MDDFAIETRIVISIGLACFIGYCVASAIDDMNADNEARRIDRLLSSAFDAGRSFQAARTPIPFSRVSPDSRDSTPKKILGRSRKPRIVSA